MSKSRILIAEDEKIARENTGHILVQAGYDVVSVENGVQAMEALAEIEFDLLITDLKMPGLDGMSVLGRIKAISPDTEVLVVTGHGSVMSAVEAMQKGAYHYLEKPYKIDVLRNLVAGALEKRSIRLKVAQLRQDCSDNDLSCIIGESPAICALKQAITQVSLTDCNVLIIGETGTGKELVARAIHSLGKRKKNRFLAVNCASFNEELLANELFGHEAGAFTGAKGLKRGLLESADQGSFLLDEIGDMELSLQAKLLRVLENRNLIRIGGTEEIPFDVRILAATNKDLKTEVEGGNFRMDLYYRLNVITLNIPSLSERRSDIPLLCNYFLNIYSKAAGKNIQDISPKFLNILAEYQFPGNVRELENIIERAVVICNGKTLQPAHLPRDLELMGTHVMRMDKKVQVICPQGIGLQPEPGELTSLKENEKCYIQHVLDAVEGNKTRAAKILDINRATLWRKLHRLGLE